MENEAVLNALNRNIEKRQFPHFQSHPTLMGWCSMNYHSNYPSVPYKDIPGQPIKESEEDLHPELNQKLENNLNHLY